MSFVDIARLPVRVGLHLADAVLQAVTQAPLARGPCGSSLERSKGFRPRRDGPSRGFPHPPNGRPARSFRAPAAPAASPAARCSGLTSFTTTTGRPACPSDIPNGGLAPHAAPTPNPSGAAARNGADIFRVAIGLTETHTWWRVD